MSRIVIRIYIGATNTSVELIKNSKVVKKIKFPTSRKIPCAVFLQKGRDQLDILTSNTPNIATLSAAALIGSETLQPKHA